MKTQPKKPLKKWVVKEVSRQLARVESMFSVYHISLPIIIFIIGFFLLCVSSATTSFISNDSYYNNANTVTFSDQDWHHISFQKDFSFIDNSVSPYYSRSADKLYHPYDILFSIFYINRADGFQSDNFQLKYFLLFLGMFLVFISLLSLQRKNIPFKIALGSFSFAGLMYLFAFLFSNLSYIPNENINLLYLFLCYNINIFVITFYILVYISLLFVCIGLFMYTVKSETKFPLMLKISLICSAVCIIVQAVLNILAYIQILESNNIMPIVMPVVFIISLLWSLGEIGSSREIIPTGKFRYGVIVSVIMVVVMVTLPVVSVNNFKNTAHSYYSEEEFVLPYSDDSQTHLKADIIRACIIKKELETFIEIDKNKDYEFSEIIYDFYDYLFKDFNPYPIKYTFFKPYNKIHCMDEDWSFDPSDIPLLNIYYLPSNKEASLLPVKRIDVPDEYDNSEDKIICVNFENLSDAINLNNYDDIESIRNNVKSYLDKVDNYDYSSIQRTYYDSRDYNTIITLFRYLKCIPDDTLLNIVNVDESVRCVLNSLYFKENRIHLNPESTNSDMLSFIISFSYVDNIQNDTIIYDSPYYNFDKFNYAKYFSLNEKYEQKCIIISSYQCDEVSDSDFAILKDFQNTDVSLFFSKNDSTILLRENLKEPNKYYLQPFDTSEKNFSSFIFFDIIEYRCNDDRKNKYFDMVYNEEQKCYDYFYKKDVYVPINVNLTYLPFINQNKYICISYQK